MTVSTTTVSNSYAGDGLTTGFAFSFVAIDTAWVKTLVNGVEVSATVTLNADQSTSPGGTAEFLTAPTSGTLVEIVREVPLTQDTRYSAYGAFPSSVHEAALDKVTMAAQDLAAGLADEVAAREDAVALAEAAALAAVADLNSSSHAIADASSILAFGSDTPRTASARAADVVYVADFGAVGDGTDETAELQAAIDAGAGRRVIFGKPATRYAISAALEVGSDTELVGQGVGGVEVQLPAGAAFSAFDFDGVTNVRVSGIWVTKAAGAAVTKYGFNVRGASTDIEFSRCAATDLQRGFNVEGWNGTVPGTAERIAFRGCLAEDSNASGFGFNVDDADVIAFDDCHASGCGLDGFKLRRSTSNVTVRGGSSKGNGTSGAGDGMDCYAGGSRFLVDGFVVETNTGSGITVKTGALNDGDAGHADTYGYVRNVLISNLRARANGSSGLNLNISEPAVLTQPLVSAVVVQGGIYEENGTNGIYCATRNTTIVAPLVKKNGQHGIATGARALDVSIVNPTLIANGTSLAGGYDGINIQGTRVRVAGGRCVGVDADTIGQDSDLAAIGTVVTQYAVRVTSGASDIEVALDSVAYVAGAGSIQVRCDMVAGRCLIRHSQDASPVVMGQGSVGSIFHKTNATVAEDALWIKGSGAPNSATGWVRAVDARTQYVHTDGANGYAPAGGSASSIIWTAVIAADRNINLPTTSVYAGMRFRIVRTAAATGAFNVKVNASAGGALLKDLAVSTWCEVEYSGSAWELVAYGTL